eukprot:TRINITY_DN16952_c0_g1_i2.p1 TRINITY_DN16952_c0_g1~~TRINITY_DN16952_c0_g1_i2.p1  ORF type:complete len:504 (+),score=138.79 TRINITY_DN16952_c0_g1_i2:199-1710(+)
MCIRDRFLSGSEDRTAQLWNQEGKPCKVLMGHRGGIRACGFAPNSGVCATGGTDGVVHLWKVPDAQRVGTLQGHDGGKIVALEFAPSGDMLAACDNKHGAILWNYRRQSRVAEVQCSTGFFTSVGFSPSGELFATASSGGRLELWRLDHQEVVLCGAVAHDSGLSSCGWSSDGSWIAAGSTNGTLCVWQAKEVMEGKEEPPAVIEGKEEPPVVMEGKEEPPAEEQQPSLRQQEEQQPVQSEVAMSPQEREHQIVRTYFGEDGSPSGSKKGGISQTRIEAAQHRGHAKLQAAKAELHDAKKDEDRKRVANAAVTEAFHQRALTQIRGKSLKKPSKMTLREPILHQPEPEPSEPAPAQAPTENMIDLATVEKLAAAERAVVEFKMQLQVSQAQTEQLATTCLKLKAENEKLVSQLEQCTCRQTGSSSPWGSAIEQAVPLDKYVPPLCAEDKVGSRKMLRGSPAPPRSRSNQKQRPSTVYGGELSPRGRRAPSPRGSRPIADMTLP